MKNKTFLTISALCMAILMLVSLFTVYATAAEKVIYDEDNCTVSYDDRTVTVTLDAAKLGDVVEKGRFNKEALKELLPEGIYRIIDERSKASVIAFLVNLAEKDVLTYDELLNAFSGNEEVMSRYINFAFIAPYVGTSKLLTKDVVERLYAEGKLDTVLANTAFREALLEKAGTKDVAEAISKYSDFAQLILDMEVGDLLPMKDIWDYADLPNIIAEAPGSKVNKSLRSFVNQVLAGEVDEAYVNGTKVLSTTEFGKELDHNALQTALLQGLPSLAQIAALGDGDTLVEYVIDTKGLENESGEARVDMQFTLKVLLKGDTSKINKYGAKLASLMEYVVADDGLITVNVTLDGKFAEEYAKVLNCDEISKERKYEYLGLYVADGATLADYLKGEKFENFLTDAKLSGVKGSEKIDTRESQIKRFAELLLKFSAYETAFTTLDDAYWGGGEFDIRLTDVIPINVIAEKAQSRFSGIEQLMAWLSQDDHLIDTEVVINIENFYRLCYVDKTFETLYVTYVPAGTDLSFFDDCAEIQGYGEYGWVDLLGEQYTEMPDFDLTLFEYTPTANIEIVKIWDDNDNAAGMRPDSVTLTLKANGEELVTFDLKEDGVDVSPEEATNFLRRLLELCGVDLSDIFGDLETDDEYGLDEDIPEGDGFFEDDPYEDDPYEDDPVEPVKLPPWTTVFNNLPAYDVNDAQITYEVVEAPVDNYTSAIEVNDGVFEITNTYESELVTVTGQKIWDDENNRRNKRPENVTIVLLANGEIVDRQVVTGEGNTWDFEFVRLAKYANGEEIEYTVDEIECEKYAKTVDGTTITNTYIKSPDTGAAEISLFVLLGTLSMAGAAAAVITFKKRREQ